MEKEMLIEENTYGKTKNYLLLEEACSKLLQGEIDEEDFYDTLDWMYDIIKRSEEQAGDVLIDEITDDEESSPDDLDMSRRLFKEGIKDYKKALMELEEYLDDPDEEYITSGLAMALEANKKLLLVQDMAEKKEKEVGELESFYSKHSFTRMSGDVVSMSYMSSPHLEGFFTKEAMEKSKNKTEIFSLIPLFSVLDETELGRISHRIKCRKYSMDDILFLEGESAEGLYIVKSGEITLYKAIDYYDVMDFLILEKGALFGEMGIISDLPRTLSARISSETAELYEISKKDFYYILETYPKVHLNFSRMLCTRIDETNKRLLEYLY